MKKAIYAITMLVGSLVAVSCQSDSEYAQQTSQPMVIKATAERVGGAVSRTQMDYGYDVLWNEGDEICVKGYRNMHHYFKLVDGAGTPYGTFECNSVSSAQGSDIEALYPRSLWNGSDFIWPANQTKTTVMPMYCHQVLTEKHLTFKSLGGIMQIVFMKNFQATFDIKTVKVEDGEKTLSGAFTVDEEGKAVITATNKAGITLEANVENLGWGACIMNVALPAGTYNSLKFTFTDKYGRVFVRNVGEPVTIGLNGITKVKVLGESFHDINTTGTAKAIINGREVDVPWVRLWFRGPKFAVYNVGVTDGNPESKGGFYNWGGTINRRTSSSSYYNTGSVTLTGSDDTATALWGPNWRMPTKTEMDYLSNSGYVQADGDDNKKVYTGKGDYANNSITLPNTGWVTKSGEYSENELVSDPGDHDGNGTFTDHVLKKCFNYWTSTPAGGGEAYRYYRGYYSNDGTSSRQLGYCIRAVLNE